MCLSIPAQIITIEGDVAQASVGGTIVTVGLQLVENVKIGDYILVHTGFALQKISEEEAQEMLQTIKEYEDFNKNLDVEEGRT